jgi:hypothetical protein
MHRELSGRSRIVRLRRLTQVFLQLRIVAEPDSATRGTVLIRRPFRKSRKV